MGKEIWERSNQSPFASLTDAIQLVALQHGIDVSDDQKHNLTRFLELEKRCDDVLDSIPFEQRGMLVRVSLDFLRSDMPSALPHLKNTEVPEEAREQLAASLEGIKTLVPSDRRTIFVDSLERFLATTMMLQQETSLIAAIRLRRESSNRELEAFFNILPTRIHKADNFDRFQRMGMIELEISDLVDTFSDFAADIKSGTLSIAPTLFNRLAFGAAGIVSGVIYLPQLMLDILRVHFSPDYRRVQEE